MRLVPSPLKTHGKGLIRVDVIQLEKTVECCPFKIFIISDGHQSCVGDDQYHEDCDKTLCYHFYIYFIN